MFNSERPDESQEDMIARWNEEQQILRHLVNDYKIYWRRGYYHCADYVGSVLPKNNNPDEDDIARLYITKTYDDISHSYALTIESLGPLLYSYTICFSTLDIQALYEEAEKQCQGVYRLCRDGDGHARKYFLGLFSPDQI